MLGVFWGKTHPYSFTYQVWDAASGEVLKCFDFKDAVYSVQFSKDGKHIVCSGNKKEIWVVNVIIVQCLMFERLESTNQLLI